jgi:FAD-linked oxidoreductase
MASRRSFLQTLVAAAVSGSTLPRITLADTAGQTPLAPTTASEVLPWRNWSGNQLCHPQQRLAPASVEALQAHLRTGRGKIRLVGAGHSFSPLAITDGTMISLDRLNGILDTDDNAVQATIGAGTRLGRIGAQLAQQDQAMINMPDIDHQTLAGCVATATHGTGADLGCLSDNIRALTLVTARGEKMICSTEQNTDLLRAAQVSLGALGAVTDITLQNTRPYRLKRVTDWLEIEDILAQADAMADQHRNFEFYYVPFSGMGFTDTQDITEEPVSSTEILDQNDGARDLKQARDLLSWSPTLRRLILGSYMRLLQKEVRVSPSWQSYTSERRVRFNEMEYHLPREDWLAAFREIRDTVERDFPECFFPFEVRFVKGDDIWLSPFYQRDCVSIAVHRFYEEDYQPMFSALEPIFRKYGGRPHWGKLNTLTTEEARRLYPRWDDFLALRRELDPDNRFLNPYLSQLFGEEYRS